MNLGQLVDPEWAQVNCPARHAPVRPAQLEPAPRVVTRTADELTDFDRERLPLAPAANQAMPQVSRVPVAKPAASPGRTRLEARRRSESNPWPRGKSGLRFRILTVIAGSRAPGVMLSDLTARIGEFSSAQVSMALGQMCAEGWLQRSGYLKRYMYAITPAGHAAKDWQG